MTKRRLAFKALASRQLRSYDFQDLPPVRIANQLASSRLARQMIGASCIIGAASRELLPVYCNLAREPRDGVKVGQDLEGLEQIKIAR